ncbi:hypothetical protein [Zhihengliuella halotolerans]|uniref:hypothetical protein n=1 Tax=Zhihengliuella halotolerans TaxID=370736 RepID=UPI000C805CB3|nr:hypothetical protein [Zhihengliuella halotolerans]
MNGRQSLEYGPPRRYTVCLVCGGAINEGIEPVCSDACWNRISEHLRLDELPDGLSRNAQIQQLAAFGRRLSWVGAWFGLSYGTVKNIARGVPRPRTPRQSERLGRGWLDRRP